MSLRPNRRHACGSRPPAEEDYSPSVVTRASRPSSPLASDPIRD